MSPGNGLAQYVVNWQLKAYTNKVSSGTRTILNNYRPIIVVPFLRHAFSKQVTSLLVAIKVCSPWLLINTLFEPWRIPGVSVL